VAELVDARDLKSLDGNVVWVRVPPPAPIAGPLVFAYVSVYSFRISGWQSLILRNVLITEVTKSPSLVSRIVRRTDNGLNFRTLKKTVDVVIVAQEIWWKLFAFLLLPEFRGDRLKFLHEGYSRDRSKPRP
jgi:hypothetical protein